MPQAQTQQQSPVMSDVVKMFPRLAPIVPNVQVQQGKTGPNDQRQLEFYPPWEQRNPNPGKITIELYRDFKGNEATSAIAGDMLHYLGAENPHTGQPIDPKYYEMKKQVFLARTPEQQKTDNHLFVQDAMRGDKRSFQQWWNQSRGDAYIRGYVTPDKADEWRKQGWYKDPKMLKAVQNIEKYLKSATDSTQ